jgi:ribonuclease J
MFRWWALGGLGEVGMNCMVFDFAGTIVPVDAGMLFADDNDFGVESLYPNYAPFIVEYKPKIWLISHAHEDHIGAIPYLLQLFETLGVSPPKIYAPRFAAGLIREKLLDGARISRGDRFTDLIHTVDRGSFFEHGAVRINMFDTPHSTPDTCSVAFETNILGAPLRVIHTADFKLELDASHYKVFSPKSVDFLFIDSTNAERAGHSVSEQTVRAPLEQLIRAAEGRVFVSLFSSNVERLLNLIDIAHRCGRKVAVAGRSLQTALRLASELDVVSELAPLLSQPLATNLDDLKSLKPEQQLVICSGSQGEDRSVLMRLSQGTHADIQTDSGDTVILSSKTIPGNEKSVSRVINGLLRQGLKVYYDDVAKREANGPIHASGHARREEIQKVIEVTRPQHLVPVHGELRQLTATADLARSLKVPNVHVVENHTRLDFVPSSEGWALAQKAALADPGRMLRFEHFFCDSKDSFLRVRKRAASGGVVSAILDSAGRVKLQSFGLAPTGQEPDLSEVERFLAGQYRQAHSMNAFSGGADSLQDLLAEDIARIVRRSTGTKPFVVVHFLSL